MDIISNNLTAVLNIVGLLVIIALVIMVLRKIEQIALNYYEESTQVFDGQYTPTVVRPLEAPFIVGDFVFSYELDSEGFVVETDSLETTVCTDSYGNEVFVGLDNNKLRLIRGAGDAVQNK